MAVFELTSGENDLSEIHQYQMGRYIGSNEAVWRILNFPIQERHPTLIYLSVHLENGQESLLHDRKCCSTYPSTCSGGFPHRRQRRPPRATRI
ncbi:hypothetical protein AVEN_196899-1 [Araneus ventricosus]|uniref:Uncharacterized protein n=1 Tax=Araneus ventricosus TaxID=182803 RepID=A0A4Y2EFU8_ARAVE|nr:hypothetical protein AVEN_196899-1 [Araneus ventricosus]